MTRASWCCRRPASPPPRRRCPRSPTSSALSPRSAISTSWSASSCAAPLRWRTRPSRFPVAGARRSSTASSTWSPAQRQTRCAPATTKSSFPIDASASRSAPTCTFPAWLATTPDRVPGFSSCRRRTRTWTPGSTAGSRSPRGGERNVRGLVRAQRSARAGRPRRTRARRGSHGGDVAVRDRHCRSSARAAPNPLHALRRLVCLAVPARRGGRARLFRAPYRAAAEYSTFPPTIVKSTRALRISSSGTVRMSLDRTVMSASLPTDREPFEPSSKAAKAAFRV
jgi:hypothetical protein